MNLFNILYTISSDFFMTWTYKTYSVKYTSYLKGVQSINLNRTYIEQIIYFDEYFFVTYFDLSGNCMVLKIKENKIIDGDNMFGIGRVNNYNKCIQGNGSPESAVSGCQIVASSER